MKTTKVIDKKTGVIYVAIYCQNNKGNLRYWIEGKFYSDRNFDKKFTIIN